MRHYWFQEMPPAVQEELVEVAGEATSRCRERPIPGEETMEAIDDYFNRHNFRQDIPEWYQTAQKFRL